MAVLIDRVPDHLATVSINWLGEWSVKEDYQRGDVVEYESVGYICNEPNTGVRPTADRDKYWEVGSGPEVYAPWVETAEYDDGSIVVHKGVKWRSWLANSNAEPGFAFQWKRDTDQSRWRGHWRAGRHYVEGDIVEHEGGTYTSRFTFIATIPPSEFPSRWTKIGEQTSPAEGPPQAGIQLRRYSPRTENGQWETFEELEDYYRKKHIAVNTEAIQCISSYLEAKLLEAIASLTSDYRNAIPYTESLALVNRCFTAQQEIQKVIENFNKVSKDKDGMQGGGRYVGVAIIGAREQIAGIIKSMEVESG